MSDTPVRVRFAPSPTGSDAGSLHVGGARTALFNWLFARQTGGAFVLRIEDTDVKRSTIASEDSLMDGLRWLGLDWDEGPDIGGPCGPYRQSERLYLYHETAQALMERGLAYPCFCREEDLEAKRERAMAEGRPPRYDGACARIDPPVAAMRAESEPHSVRFRVPEREVQVPDLLRGEVVFGVEAVGDFILLRPDGMPVYNFACVVDDAAMEITHVLRGEDHLPNSLRQVLLYEALGLPVPVLVHVSMILGADRTKLSKRHGALSIDHYRAQGYPPEALINYLALLGWNPGDGREAMSREELVAAFSLERLVRSPAIFDPDKLDWLAGLKIRQAGPEALLEASRRYLPDETDARRLRMIAAVIDHLRCAADLPEELQLLRGERPELTPEAQRWLENRELLQLVTNLLAQPLYGDGAAAAGLPAGALTADEFTRAVKEAGRDLDLKGKRLFMPLRVALTGVDQGPELAAIAEILGREEVLARLRYSTQEG
ncbi:MAG: glutamate--tRNA ligase [Candidatus Krumholzibacteriota bacterium]|nr:glutamate--tRNA ligase [Candidatus Krumholzibacteriota bacterium]